MGVLEGYGSTVGYTSDIGSMYGGSPPSIA